MFKESDFIQGCLQVLIMLTLFFAASNALSQSIKICEDIENFAPFMYAVPGDVRSAPHLEGFTVELVKSIEKQLNQPIRYDLIPLNRCIEQVTQGDYDLVADVYLDKGRAEKMAYSHAYYSLTPQIFYLKSFWPNGFPVVKIEQLPKYRGCGVLGYTYQHYGLSRGAIDQGTANHEQLIAKLKRRRCDYFPEEMEVMTGFSQTGTPYLADPDLGHHGITGTTPPELHFMVSKSNPRGAALLKRLNVVIDDLIRNGSVARLAQRHGLNADVQNPPMQIPHSTSP